MYGQSSVSDDAQGEAVHGRSRREHEADRADKGVVTVPAATNKSLPLQPSSPTDHPTSISSEASMSTVTASPRSSTGIGITEETSTTSLTERSRPPRPPSKAPTPALPPKPQPPSTWRARPRAGTSASTGAATKRRPTSTYSVQSMGGAPLAPSASVPLTPRPPEPSNATASAADSPSQSRSGLSLRARLHLPGSGGNSIGHITHSRRESKPQVGAPSFGATHSVSTTPTARYGPGGVGMTAAGAPAISSSSSSSTPAFFGRVHKKVWGESSWAKGVHNKLWKPLG
ncbi:uncharacterized protein EHS24_007306 [Apiotrichum porosum]|uniref:Uncharacterized protein n=1 Tax=Apiotrichum porosum TaxID=105984 RepID=A0A427XU32_9TREE|nr:uncharacterized protein EHS24_007306 [Apiotrichum porosum]RSH82339.1 hypothetical protein EHS24_007306 [Apiotrichum porosum]